MKKYRTHSQEKDNIINKLKKKILKSEKMVTIITDFSKISTAMGIILIGVGVINQLESSEFGMPIILTGLATVVAGLGSFAAGFSEACKAHKLRKDCEKYEQSINEQTENLIGR